MRLIVFGLSLSSSWGNGHATTYRALLRAFAARGHEIVFFERNESWYLDHRDLAAPDFCHLVLYDGFGELERWRQMIREADAVIIGSFVRDGVTLAKDVLATAEGVTAFYDIDTPVTLAKLRSGDYEYLSPEIISQFDLYLSFTGGPLLQEIESWYGARRALPLYCSADEELYGPIRSARKWDLSYLGTYSPDRQPILARLMIEAARYSPRMRFVVAGPQYPEGIEWPGNIERLEHVSPADHAAFYSASRFTLNVTRRNMIDAGFSPSVRLFEAAACRCPVLSDYWNGLDAFFAPGREIIVCSDTKDVISALAMPEETGRDIAEAAHRRTMAGHTGTHRARELERYIRAARRQDVAADEHVPLREGVT